MKRFLLLLPLALLAAPGCVGTEALLWKRPAAETQVKTPAAAPPGVQPDDVNETNAAAKLQALRAEIEYDANEKNAPKGETPKQ
jgi:hypothetical protein